MRIITDRKRAEGRGASGTGTAHHWYMQASSVGLLFLIPPFVYFVGSRLGAGHGEVLATFGHPFVAIVTALALLIGLRHFAKGAQMMIEDYARGAWRKGLVVFALSLSYIVTATGLFALAKIAF